MRRLPACVVLLALAGLGGCLSDTVPTGPLEVPSLAFSPPASACTNDEVGTNNAVSGLAQFKRHSRCGAVATLTPADAPSAAAVATAVSIWNAALRADALPNTVPRLESDLGGIPVTVTGSDPDGLYCGETDPNHSPPQYIQIKPKSGGGCPNNADGIDAVMIHEVAHVLGFTDGSYEKSTTPGDCVIHLAGERNLNRTPCRQEVEYIYAGYGLLDRAIASTIWDKTILKGPTLAAHALTVQATLTVKDSVARVAADPPGSTLPGDFLTSSSFTWSSDNTNIASLAPSASRVATI